MILIVPALFLASMATNFYFSYTLFVHNDLTAPSSLLRMMVHLFQRYSLTRQYLHGYIT